jgi:hypothetical protein
MLTVLWQSTYADDPPGWDAVGADDRAGANYTGQPAVHSYYAED